MQHPAAFLSVRHSEWAWPEDPPPLEEFPLREQILVVLAHQPWASASDIARRLDRDESDVYEACNELEKEGLIAGRAMGVTRRAQRRYVLTRAGVRHVTKAFRYKDLVRPALPRTWQMTEEGVTRMMRWLPMVESLYEILPTFWTSGLARPFQWQFPYPEPSSSSLVWLGVPTLTEVRWLPSSRLHVVTTWRFERDSKPARYCSFPFLWSGLLAQEDYLARSLRTTSKFIRCERDQTDAVWWDIEPPVVAIGTDEFGAFRSCIAYGDDVQVGSVDTAGALVWSAGASHSEWTWGETPPKSRSIGKPEAAAIGEGPDLVNLGGIPEYRVLSFIAEFRSATREILKTALRMSGESVNAAVEALVGRGLVTRVGKHFYVTQRAREMLADRDRIDANRLVEVTYEDPEGADAERERRHDKAVAQVAAEFLRAKMPVAAGWRWVVSWEDGQLVPDLWVRVPDPGREEGIWVAVEVEFSARTEKRIEKKLRSYRLASIRIDKDFPVLVITGEEPAAKRFDDLARNVTVHSTTLKQFRTRVWEGPESVWRRNSRPAALTDIASERLYHLRQPTGRSLDYSKPTPEVWETLMGEERIWAVPWAEGLGQETPLIDPHLLAEMDRMLDEGKAVPSISRPVSGLLPPTPSPAAPGKAAAVQARAPQEALPPRVPSPGPTRTRPTPQDLVQNRRQVLRKVGFLVAEADRVAGRRLEEAGLTDAERLCLQRVRAILIYGAARKFQIDQLGLQKVVHHCSRAGGPA